MHIHTNLKKVKTIIVFMLNLWTCSNIYNFQKNWDMSLFKQVIKYGKRIALIFLYTLYKAWRTSESSFSDSFIVIFSFFFIYNAMNFFIHSLNRFVFEKLFTGCWFSSVLCSFLSLYMQIYLLNACKLNWEEKLFGFYAESIAFRIKIFMRISLIISDSSICLKVTCV